MLGLAGLAWGSHRCICSSNRWCSSSHCSNKEGSRDSHKGCECGGHTRRILYT